MGKEKRFEGRTAMVTGGAGDIGRTTALRLAAEGAAIALVDIKRDGLQNAQREIAETGVRVEIYECDVRTYDAVARMVGQAAMDFGRLDFLFNNAGYQGVFKPTHEYPADDFEQLIQINVNGAFFVLKAVSEHMVASGGRSPLR